MIDYLVDNDAAIKLIRYHLIQELLDHCQDPAGSREIAMLGTARWVCHRELERAVRLNGEAPSIMASFETLWARVVILEPVTEEIALAARLEDLANAHGLALDPGESQMVAMLTNRAGILVTGDKRALVALERLLDEEIRLSTVAKRVASLEHAMMTLVLHLGLVAVSGAVGDAPAADKAMRLALAPPPAIEGLLSYLGSLRRAAPRVLLEPDSLCFDWLP